MLPNVKTKYQKEIKVVIFLLVLYSLAKCFYSVFTLSLSHFVWKNNNLRVHFQHWQLQVTQIYMPSSFFLCPDINHSALETPAVRPTKNSWFVHKMWVAAHWLLSLQLLSPLSCAGENKTMRTGLSWNVFICLPREPKTSRTYSKATAPLLLFTCT